MNLSRHVRTLKESWDKVGSTGKIMNNNQLDVLYLNTHCIHLHPFQLFPERGMLERITGGFIM